MLSRGLNAEFTFNSNLCFRATAESFFAPPTNLGVNTQAPPPPAAKMSRLERTPSTEREGEGGGEIMACCSHQYPTDGALVCVLGRVKINSFLSFLHSYPSSGGISPVPFHCPQDGKPSSFLRGFLPGWKVRGRGALDELFLLLLLLLLILYPGASTTIRRPQCK